MINSNDIPNVLNWNWSTQARRPRIWDNRIVGFWVERTILRQPTTKQLCRKYASWLAWKRKADSRLAPSQWETSLQSNAVSHWLGANPESALKLPGLNKIISMLMHRSYVFLALTHWFEVCWFHSCVSKTTNWQYKTKTVDWPVKLHILPLILCHCNNYRCHLFTLNELWGTISCYHHKVHLVWINGTCNYPSLCKYGL